MVFYSEPQIFIASGSTGSVTFNLKNVVGNPLDLSGFTIVFYAGSGENPSLSGTSFRVVGEPLDVTGGVVRFDFTPQQTSAISETKYYDLEAQDDSANKVLILNNQQLVLSYGARGVSALDWKSDTILGQVTGAYDLEYYAGGASYTDTDEDVTLVFSPTQEGYWSFDGWQGQIRLQVSLSGGPLYDAGPIIKSRIAASPNGNLGTIPIKDTLENAAFCVKRGDYLYVYYNSDRISATVANSVTEFGTLCVARSLYSDVISFAKNKSVSTWYKYYNGTWTELGLGGNATNLLKNYGVSVDGVPKIAGVYSSQLNKTVILFTTRLRVLDSNLYSFSFSQPRDVFAIYSEDGYNFSFPQRLNISTSGSYDVAVLGNKSYLGYSDGQLRVFTASGDTGSLGVGTFTLSALPTTNIPRTFTEGIYTNVFKLSESSDHGQLHPFIAAIHYISEQKKIIEASAYYDENPAVYKKRNGWKNVLQSYANSSTEFSGAFPNSISDYENFQLGDDFHRYYHEYTHNFNRHRLNSEIVTMDGPTIFSHSFGPLIYNSDLSKTNLQAGITSSLANLIDHKNNQGIFFSGATASGTYVASSIVGLDYSTAKKEYRNSSIIDHVELCQVSGSSQNNSFSVINVTSVDKYSRATRTLLLDNVLIKQSAVDGFGRIIFDISKYQITSPKYDVTNNFLLPEHKFKLKFKVTSSNLSGDRIGGATIGVWIHTKPELDKIWSLTKNGTWVQHSAFVTKEQILNNYNSSLITLNQQERSSLPQETQQDRCEKFITERPSSEQSNSISRISYSDFSEFSIDFNTYNINPITRQRIHLPFEYMNKVSTDLHRKNQNYVIEVFTLPNQRSGEYTLYYDFSIIDQTLNELSKPLVLERNCKKYSIEIPKEKISDIFKYYNQITGAFKYNNYSNNLAGYASRTASVTQEFYEVSGGSRINYVESPYWLSSTINTSGVFEQIQIIN